VTGLLLLTIALIVYGSLYPWQFDFDRTGINPLAFLLAAWPDSFDRWTLRDIAVNVLLYLPLGLTAFVVTARRYGRALAFGAAVVLGVALSSCMELLQIYDDHRVCNLLDVCSNSLGAFGGAAMALVFQPQLARFGHRQEHPHARSALLLVFAWLGYQLYPLFPALTRTHLRAGVHALLQTARFSPAEAWVVAAGWFAAALALEALMPRLSFPWLAVLAAAVCLPGQLLIADREPRLHELAGATLASLLWRVLPSRMRPAVALWLLVSAILVRELEPFRFTAAAAPFSWIPFAASFASDREPATVVLFGKAFYYGAAIWLMSARGWPYAHSTALVAAALALLEAAQRYQPGRTPEITDAVLALLMGLILWVLRDRETKKSGRSLRRDIAPI